MGLNFKIWLEERIGERNIRKMFIKRLGFNPSAADDPSIYQLSIRSYKDQVIKALKNMGLAEDVVERLINWVDSNEDKPINNLIAQIRPVDLMTTQQKSPEEEELPGQQAMLPPGEERPTPKPAGQPGVPPTQGRMQVPF